MTTNDPFIADPAKCRINAGTEGRVYGGNPNLLHVADGTRADLGHLMAAFMEGYIREHAENRTDRQKELQKLCPGCYMVVAFNMLLVLARDNNQSTTELARCMRNAFDRLLANPNSGLTEEIEVLLDPE